MGNKSTNNGRAGAASGRSAAAAGAGAGQKAVTISDHRLSGGGDEDGPTTPTSHLSVNVGGVGEFGDGDPDDFEVEPGDDWVPFDPRSPRAVKAYVFPWISDDWAKILSEQNFRLFPKLEDMIATVKKICGFPETLATEVTDFLGAGDWLSLVTDLSRQAPFHKAILLGTAGVKADPSRTTYIVIKLWLKWTAQKILSVSFEEALGNVTIKMAGEAHHRRSISESGHSGSLSGEEHLPVALLCVPESTSSWDVAMAQRSRRPSIAPGAGGSRRPSMASNPGSAVLGQGNIGGVLTIPPDMPGARGPSSPPLVSGSPLLAAHSLAQRPAAVSGSGSGPGSQTSSPTNRFTFNVSASGSSPVLGGSGHTPERKS